MKSLEDFRLEAYRILREKVPSMAKSWCDIRGGAGYGVTYRRNREALREIFLRPKFLSAKDSVDTSVNLFGRSFSLPILPAPFGMRIQAIRKDIFEVIAEACEESSSSLIWFIKPMRSRERMKELFEAANSIETLAIGMDVDSVCGICEGFTVLFEDQFSPQDQNELAEMIENSSSPFILKGILSEEDNRSSSEARSSTKDG